MTILSLLGLAPQSTLAQSCQPYPSPHQRFGVNVARDGNVSIDDYAAHLLNAGWYHDYGTRLTPSHPGGMRYYQMIRAKFGVNDLDGRLGPIVDANPGAVWLIGNEPDVWGQDSQTPADYAVFYHTIYTFLKQRDPTSHVSAGGIVEPSVLRMRYLSMVLTEYQSRYGTPLPADSWQIHLIILPENCDTWGAHIPPGLNAYASEGLTCASHDDHGNIEIFKKMVVDFRQWMKDNGYRDLPLIISEYGIMYSPYHGYDNNRVRDYMYATFDYMLSKTDSNLGYPADGNRLVQEWGWFSLNYYEFDPFTYRGLNGNLFDHDSRQIEFFGTAFLNYTQQRMVKQIDLTFTGFTVTPLQPQHNTPVTLHAEFLNQGSIDAQEVAVRFWQGDPRSNGQLLGSTPVQPLAPVGCDGPLTADFVWTPADGGNYEIFAELIAANLGLEGDLTNNYAQQSVSVTGPEATPTSTPTVTPTLVDPPTFTPTPTPTSTSVGGGDASVVVFPNQGGRIDYISSSGVRISIAIPAAAVDQETLLVFKELGAPAVGAANLAFAGYAFSLAAYQNGVLVNNFVFQNPVTMTINQLPSQVGINEEELMLYTFDSTTKRWHLNGLTLLTRDLANRRLTVLSARPGEFALFAPGVAGSTATTTPTPTATATATVTPSPTLTLVDGQTSQYQIYLPLTTK